MKNYNKSSIEIILKEFKKTALGKNAVENNYNDDEIMKIYSKKIMLEKIKTLKIDNIKSKNIENILKNTKQKYKDCWDWELIK